jgi:hypothetical protein
MKEDEVWQIYKHGRTVWDEKREYDYHYQSSHFFYIHVFGHSDPVARIGYSTTEVSIKDDLLIIKTEYETKTHVETRYEYVPLAMITHVIFKHD